MPIMEEEAQATSSISLYLSNLEWPSSMPQLEWGPTTGGYLTRVLSVFMSREDQG